MALRTDVNFYTRNAFLLSVFALLAISALNVPSSFADDHPPELITSKYLGLKSAPSQTNPNILDSIGVELDPTVLDSPQITITPFSETFVVNHEKTIVRGAEDFTWVGSTESHHNNVFIAYLNGDIRIEMSMPSNYYELTTNDADMHTFTKFVSLGFDPEGEGDSSLALNPDYDSIIDSLEEGDFTATDYHTLQIDVLFLTTDRVEDELSSSAIRLMANLAVDKTNISFESSDIPLELVSAGIENAGRGYVESDMVTDLDRLLDPDDGHLDRGFALRNSEDADIGVMYNYVETQRGFGGLASQILASEDTAFVAINVASDDNYDLNQVVAHELGHLAGAYHNFDTNILQGNSAGYFDTPFEFGHGYTDPSKRYTSLMGYPCNDCSWMNQWSDPGVDFKLTEIPSGTHEREDVANVWRLTGPFLASLKGETQSYVPIHTPDQESPNITVPADMEFEATAALTPLTTSDYGTATATDNVDLPEDITITNDAPESFPLGETKITWTATDTAGNPAYGEQRITIVDTTAPVFDESTLVDAIDQYAESSDGGMVEFAVPIATDLVDGTIQSECTPQSGSIFPIGETGVTCTATDLSENTVSTSFTITISMTVPDLPPNFEAIPISPTKIHLTWDKPESNGGSPITGYDIKYNYFNPGEESTSLENSIVLAEGIDTTEIVHTGVHPTYTYSYDIYAINNVGYGPVSTVHVTLPDPQPPSVPLNLEAAVSALPPPAARIDLSWDEPEYPGTSHDPRYKVQRSLDGQEWSNVGKWHWKTSAADTSKEISSADVIYYRVLADTVVGSSPYTLVTVGIPQVYCNAMTIDEIISSDEYDNVLDHRHETVPVDISGTDKADIILASPFGGTIDAGDGNDCIIGSSAADVINGGNGKDIIYGLGGNDEINGQQGSDIIYSGTDNDTVYGGSGVDHIFGQGGDDMLYGNGHTDYVFGGLGNDEIDCGGGYDRAYGGSGQDTRVSCERSSGFP